MKILHISKYFPPNYGGLENQVKNICDYLYLKKCEVEVLAFGRKNCVKKKKYKVYEFKPFLKLFSQPLSIRYLIFARKLIRKNDIIHFHYPNIVGLLACYLFCTNQILYVHWHSDILKQKYINYFFSFFEKKLLQNSKKIIFTSKNYAKEFKYYDLFRKKIKIINCGTDDLSLQFEKNKEAKKFFFKIKKNYKSFKIIYSIGRLVPYKGFKYLINSAKYLNDNFKIIIAGQGKDYNKLKNIIIKNNLQRKVLLINKISHSKHLAFLKLCNVFCLPSISKNEAFGVVLIEAMSFSKPIVSTLINGSGVNFVNNHQVTGYKVPIKNSKKLALSILKIIESKKKYNKFCLNSKKRYKKFFTSQLMNKNFYRNYKVDYEINKK